MSSYQDISAEALADMLANNPPLLIDVRNDDEVVRGVIAGATHIPLAMLPMAYDSISKASHIVFYCHSGIRSAHAAAFAASQGCKEAYNLTGGILAWGRAGLPFVPYK